VAKCRRKPLLDEVKKAEIIAILSVGCSRQTAAKYVGCSPATICRTAQREPEFSKQLRQTEGNQELGYLKNIKRAAQQERYWRAAAWVLERKFPNDYGRRGPDVITVGQITEVLARFAEIITEEVPDEEDRKRILKRLGTISARLNDASKQ